MYILGSLGATEGPSDSLNEYWRVKTTLSRQPESSESC